MVLITGCSSGFGFEAALTFAREGHTVAAAVRRPERAEQLRQQASLEGLAIHIRQLDTTRPDDFPGFLAQLEQELGPLDILVNNAGIHKRGALEDLPEADIRAVMETNFFGPLLLTRAALPRMRERRNGVIIMMSSLSGIAGLAGDVIYSASKFALEGATEALSYECRRFGIRFALVECGSYATGLQGGEPDDDYPRHSPYRPLIQSQQAQATAARGQAPHPRQVGELLPAIAGAHNGPLRWQADALAKHVMQTLWRADNEARDQFLRQASAIDWWLDGREAPLDNDAP
nr:SDR family oxidoreductase [Parahaliea mediterranea]